MNDAEWLSAADATDLWAFVRAERRFNRNGVKNPAGEEDEYNQRLLYLLGVSVCRRLEPLFPDPCCQRMIQIAEAYAEGTATLDELEDAHEAIPDTTDYEAAVRAAVDAVFWLSPDDYKVIRGVDIATDAAGYLHAIAAGVLPARATQREGKAIWKHPAFLAGKEAEERVVCDLIRDIFGNPFRPIAFDTAWLSWHCGLLVSMAQKMYDSRDFSDIPVLADALEEAGCSDQDIVDHCRQPGEHVRGCWIVDLLLGKD
ncbi:MAG: hypothetical protein ACRELG_13415 [Gemmataceae bacterium]